MVVKRKKGTYELVSFDSGRRLNMVPDFAEAVITGEDVNALTVAYEEYLQTAKKNREIDYRRKYSDVANRRNFSARIYS